ncbi:hypothetical protein [Nitrosomonas halophila]|uniref:Uncharacterized protein n=1 Tax=Nitrosomonas halophila TaxID=44576 RepID=A0A1H3C6B8_9PROT|nr:hypothetical protein [Nitrosomonas halophila]SDX49615.1 hypothetical protein SAMN05421881_100279 [Nitrosomonas halophila]
MPTLNWIGKQTVVKHHKEVPFRLLEPVSNLSCGPEDTGNLIDWSLTPGRYVSVAPKEEEGEDFDFEELGI